MADYIKREDVINEINDFRLIGAPNWIETEIEEVFEAINEIPAANVVERKRGHWGLKANCSNRGFFIPFFSCSECDSSNTFRSNFCPDCGADMRGEE